MATYHLQFPLLGLAGWVNRHQQAVIDYVREGHLRAHRPHGGGQSRLWGYTRLRGALQNLGYELGRNTIKRILADHGIAPAPERGKSMSWRNDRLERGLLASRLSQERLD